MGFFFAISFRALALGVLTTMTFGQVLAQNSQEWTRLRTFPEIPITQDVFGGPLQSDRDLDCLSDDLEWILASQFAPYFVFDSRENARQPNEPLTLFQVHTGIIRSTHRADAIACSNPPREIKIRYAYLFKRDGGYATSAWCGDDHWGDNTAATVTLSITRAPDATRGEIQSLRLKEVQFGSFLWSKHAVRLIHRFHPVIYLSAGKHHEFMAPAPGGIIDNSPYSNWGCQDGVDGRGVQAWARLEDTRAPRGLLNVGESHAHPSEFFVVDLSHLGLAGESAWGIAPFCGGAGRDCSQVVAPMSQVWLR